MMQLSEFEINRRLNRKNHTQQNCATLRTEIKSFAGFVRSAEGFPGDFDEMFKLWAPDSIPPPPSVESEQRGGYSYVKYP